MSTKETSLIGALFVSISVYLSHIYLIHIFIHIGLVLDSLMHTLHPCNLILSSATYSLSTIPFSLSYTHTRNSFSLCIFCAYPDLIVVSIYTPVTAALWLTSSCPTVSPLEVPKACVISQRKLRKVTHLFLYFSSFKKVNIPF